MPGGETAAGYLCREPISPIPMRFDIDLLMEEIRPMYESADPAHDLTHVSRVLMNAISIGEREGADLQVLYFASLLHDAGSGSKYSEESVDEEERHQRDAEEFMLARGLDEDVISQVLYAVSVHRYSKGISPETLEAKILQDADRLDALGAVGIARVFMTGGSIGRGFYNPADPFCTSREPDDSRWNLDHFFRKLLKLESGMHTKAAREIARRRSEVLRNYLSELKSEIEGHQEFRLPG